MLTLRRRTGPSGFAPVAAQNGTVSSVAAEPATQCADSLSTRSNIARHGDDMPEVRDWTSQ